MQTYGLIGYPLSHSFSKKFFTAKFEAESIEAEYLNFEIRDISLLPAVLKEHPGLLGFNVTIPYKQAIIPYLESCDPKAAAINAVNTVKVDRSDGTPRLKGFNTDLIGFRDSIDPLLKSHHTGALVLGTGGASKAVVAVLADLSIPSLLVSRDSKPGVSISYQHLTRKLLEEHTIIVGTLIDVGLEKLSIEDFRVVITKKNRSSAGASVAAKGLFLVDIGYPEEIKNLS